MKPGSLVTLNRPLPVDVSVALQLCGAKPIKFGDIYTVNEIDENEEEPGRLLITLVERPIVIDGEEMGTPIELFKELEVMDIEEVISETLKSAA